LLKNFSLFIVHTFFNIIMMMIFFYIFNILKIWFSWHRIFIVMIKLNVRLNVLYLARLLFSSCLSFYIYALWTNFHLLEVINGSFIPILILFHDTLKLLKTYLLQTLLKWIMSPLSRSPTKKLACKLHNLVISFILYLQYHKLKNKVINL